MRFNAALILLCAALLPIPAWAAPGDDLMSSEALNQILVAKYGDKLPVAERAKLVAAHVTFARIAEDGGIGSDHHERVAMSSIRNLLRMADRFVQHRGRGLTDGELLRDVMNGAYRNGLTHPADRRIVDQVLDVIAPSVKPATLDLKVTPTTVSIGRATLPKAGPEKLPAMDEQLRAELRVSSAYRAVLGTGRTSASSTGAAPRGKR
jgi:hypothetical protein